MKIETYEKVNIVTLSRSKFATLSQDFLKFFSSEIDVVFKTKTEDDPNLIKVSIDNKLLSIDAILLLLNAESPSDVTIINRIEEERILNIQLQKINAHSLLWNEINQFIIDYRNFQQSEFHSHYSHGNAGCSFIMEWKFKDITPKNLELYEEQLIQKIKKFSFLNSLLSNNIIDISSESYRGRFELRLNVRVKELI